MNTSGNSSPASAAQAIEAALLQQQGIAHAFFTRQGGVSDGVYASLNGGVGSKDDPQAVQENRARMAARIGVAAQQFLVPYQIHSADVLAVDKAWADGERPRCDGLVCAARGVALGVTGADCGIVLFADAGAGVIGAAHAGWKGALTGVLESALDGMERLGARRDHVVAVLGPTIGPRSYEVGREFVARFEQAEQSYSQFFTPSAREGHSMFDLPGFIGLRLNRAGLGAFEDLSLDTYADDSRFYSYRRSVHRKEADYGRLVAAIALV